MSRYNPYYFILFVLIIFGAFASMAQNDYGIKILGGAALAFGFLFLLQTLNLLKAKKKINWVVVLELIGLIIISIILFLRVFYIRFPFVELVFGLAGLLVIISYVFRITNVWRTVRFKSLVLTLLLICFLGSITCYTVSMTLVPFNPFIADYFGVAAFILLMLFLSGAIIRRQILVDGERLSAFSYVAKVRDRSIVLIALFLLFTAYIGLTKVDFIPAMYSDQYPQAYFKLVNKAETGLDKAIEGKYRHEEFKEQYDKFIERHSSK